MASAEKNFSKFFIHFLLISATLCDSTEDFLSNFEAAEDAHDSHISSDNPTYSETSTYSVISEPYLNTDVITDEELQTAVKNQSLDVPETLKEVTTTISPDSKSLNNESENKGTTVAVEKKTDFLEHESVKSSGDNLDKTTMSKVSTSLATETPTTMKSSTTTTKSTTTTTKSTTTTTKSTTTTTKSTTTTPEITTTKIKPTLPPGVLEYTENGVECRTLCEKQGEAYYWCWQITGSWDYCIPYVPETVPTKSTTTTTEIPTTTTKSTTTTTKSTTTTTKSTTTTTKSTTTTTKSTTTTTEIPTTTTKATTTTMKLTTTTTETPNTTKKSTTTTTETPTTTNSKLEILNRDGVVEYTDDGVECKTKCEKSGESYDWCYEATGSWDYCTPAVEPTTTMKITTTTTKSSTPTTETPTKSIEIKENDLDSVEVFEFVNKPIQARIFNNDWKMDKNIQEVDKNVQKMDKNIPVIQARMMSNEWEMDKVLSRKLPNIVQDTNSEDRVLDFVSKMNEIDNRASHQTVIKAPVMKGNVRNFEYENFAPEVRAAGDFEVDNMEIMKNPEKNMENFAGYSNVQVSHIDPESGPSHKMRGENKGAEQTYNKCFGMSPEYEGKDHPCIFPFIYRGIVYENCTYVADSQPWCATAVDENDHLVSNDWGYCTAACPVMRHNPCRTVDGGPVVGAFCRFPFRYKDIEYNMCTLVDHKLTPDAIEAGVHENQGWCATKVDTHDDYIPHHWGICQPECKPATTEPPKPCNTTATTSTSMTTSEITTAEVPICDDPLECEPRICLSGDPDCDPTPPTITMTTPTTPTEGTPTPPTGTPTEGTPTPPTGTPTGETPTPIVGTPITNTPTPNITLATDPTPFFTPGLCIPGAETPGCFTDTPTPETETPPTMMTTPTPTMNTTEPTVTPIFSGGPCIPGAETPGCFTETPPTIITTPDTTMVTTEPPTSETPTTPTTTTTETTTTTMPTTVTTEPPCISSLPVCDAMCAVDSKMCITGCREDASSNLLMCKRNCVLGGMNEFCIGECMEAPEECRVKKHIMPYDQLSNQDERAVYIPKVYSDPILNILQEAAIPVEAR